MSKAREITYATAILGIALIAFSVMADAQEDFETEPLKIEKRLRIGDYLEQKIKITNNRENRASIAITIDGDIKAIAKLERENAVIEPKRKEEIKVTFFGENISTYTGSIVILGNLNTKIPVEISVSDTNNVPVDAMLIEIEPITEKAVVGSLFSFKVSVQNLLAGEVYDVRLKYTIDRLEDQTTYQLNKSFYGEEETLELRNSLSLVKEYKMPKFILPGTYVIHVKAEYMGIESSASRTFTVIEPFWDHVFLGILPVRWVMFLGLVGLVLGSCLLIYLKSKAKKKRYVVKIDYNLLPKPGPRAAYIGMVAETIKKTYFDLDALTTHTLIAGSTGGGKTVSAEVLVEEALIKGVSVIAFDPTAQWTGFLRKNTDKKMFTLYPKFGLKKTDARAFNGNVRQITDAREMIEIKKYMKPGEINVFSITKLDPEDADILVANTIRSIFRSNMPESRELKVLIIFDEVHRLLPKFGGSGQGFIQIERACREFRKWGVGLFLISQVLTDFVGETKANINTEIQMRTRDQGDLDRIKNKYGGYMLQSLLKSSTGTGMLENAQFNRGNPYFVAFRPLLHEHARLTDDELDNYNRYNDRIDELDYSIECLEKESIDIFDLKLELKMALDKVKSGSFNMVDIYLEGLKPRVEEQWKRLGKEPAKKTARLVSEDELKEEFLKAQQARKEYEEKGGTAAKGAGGAIIKPLKFSNGIMVTKKNELLDALEAMNITTFQQHVNDKKNEVADWMKLISKGIGEELAKTTDREEMIKILSKD